MSAQNTMEALTSLWLASMSAGGVCLEEVTKDSGSLCPTMFVGLQMKGSVACGATHGA